MPAPYAPQPTSQVGLFLGGLRHDVMEYSSAGLTLHRTALDTAGLDEVRRGEPCPATLQVHGEMYGVVLRLAAQGPLHVEFAFVSLAVQARGALEHYAQEEADEGEEVESSGAELPGPMALAFSRLTEPPVVPEGKRFVVPESQRVYAVTLERQKATAPPERDVDSVPEPSPDFESVPSFEVSAFGPREAFAYGLAFVALVALLLLWTVS